MAAITIEQALDTALTHHRAGRLRDAEAIYRQILSRFPQHADALHLLGVVAHQVGRHAEGAHLIRQAIAIQPREAEYHNNLGLTLLAANQVDQAIAAGRQAAQIAPNHPDIWKNLGDALLRKGKPADAADAFERALLIRPADAYSWNNLAACRQMLGRLDQAAEAARRAIAQDPTRGNAHLVLGNVLKDQGRIGEAIAEYRRAIFYQPRSVTIYSNILYALHFDPASTNASIYAEFCLFNAAYARPLEQQVRPHANERSPQRRLRIGYVSPDFRAHSTSLFTRTLLAGHDRQQFEVYCYADVPRPDIVTDSLRQHAAVWRDIVNLSDAEVAEMIAADGIDILLDLAMHTANGRPLLFARKPAPVQVCWLGYPGTTGLTTMNYRITDHFLDPPGMNDAWYFEESVRLRHAMWCYSVPDEEPPINPLPAQKSGRITFGCFNNFCKANDFVQELWTQVLASIPDSRLLIIAPQGETRSRLLEKFSRAGVAADRIEFIDRRSWAQYMALYHQVDIVLDTYPWNGHTMTLDALRMGVPVVTLCGQTAVSRAGLCFLSVLGIDDLVAYTPKEYVATAMKLAADIPRLQGLRATLRERMTKSPLMDHVGFVRQIEAALRNMWRRWCGATSTGDASPSASPADAEAQ